VRYTENGDPKQVLKLESVALPSDLRDNEILVKVLQSPINPADFNIVQGNYGVKVPLPAVAGNEGVGVVAQVGKNVTSFSINDRVIPAKANLGLWRTYGVFAESDFLKIPYEIPTEYGATASVNPCTALRLLTDFGELREGDVVVQNGANSAVGLSVIQIAKERKIKTINIIRHRPNFETKIDLLKSLGADMVVFDDYITKPAFRRLISDLPAPKLALNSIGGESATEMARMLGRGGTLVTFGGMSRKPVTIPTSLFIFKDIQLRGFWLTRWVEEHSREERMKMLQTIFDMVKAQKLTLWLEKWDFDKFDQALAEALQPYRDRKIVLNME